MTTLKSRRWMFVVYNYTAQLELLKAHIETIIGTGWGRYAIIGEETCPTTGTPHLQGFLLTSNSNTKSNVVAKLNHEAPLHFAVQECFNDNTKSMINYCKGLTAEKQNNKPESEWTPQSYFEFGNPPENQGKRNDLTAAVNMLKSGLSMSAIAEHSSETYVKYFSGLHKLQDILQKQRDFKTEVIWIYGPTGSGKSRFAWENTKNAYYKNPTTKWWCGYTGQDEVIIDDFRPTKEMPFHYILGLFDRYPFSVETKHGNCQFLSKRIIVTSPFSLTEMLNQDTLQWVNDENKQQLKRRITQEIHMTPQFPWILNPPGSQELLVPHGDMIPPVRIAEAQEVMTQNY